MSVKATIREKLSVVMSQAREKERAMLIDQGATVEEVAAFEARRVAVWSAWFNKTVDDMARLVSDDRAVTGELQ